MWVYMLINQPNSRQTHGETSLVLISLYWIVAIHQESLTVGDVFMCHEVCVVYSNYVFSNHLIYSWNSINPHLRMGNTKKLWPMICVVATQLLTGKQTNDILALKNPVLQWWTSNCDPKWLDCLKDKWYGTNIIYIYVTNPIYPLELYNLRNHHNPAVFCCRGKNNGTMLPSGNQTWPPKYPASDWLFSHFPPT